VHARVWLRAMYGFFSFSSGLRVSELPPYRELLEHRGYVEEAHRERRFGLIRSSYFHTKRANSRSLRTRSTGKT
jgi:hypothetical protein